MFEVGDKVMHHDYGMCRITGIAARKFPGQDEKTYYEMVPLADDGFSTIFYTDVTQTGKMREPMSRDQILEMIDSMPETDPLTIESTGNRAMDLEKVKTTYTALMHSGNPQDWVILLRTIYRKGKQLSAQRKRLSEFEAHTRDNSERLLYGEIAGVMDIPINDVEKFIARRIEEKC